MPDKCLKTWMLLALGVPFSGLDLHVTYSFPCNILDRLRLSQLISEEAHKASFSIGTSSVYVLILALNFEGNCCSH